MARFLWLALLASGSLPAQDTLVPEAKSQWSTVRDNLLKMAEKMPADDYGFKPTPRIQSFAQRLAHIAGANLFVCRGVMGIDGSLRAGSASESKPELIASLKQSSQACDAAFASLTDATAIEKISARFGGPFPQEPMRTKLATL